MRKLMSDLVEDTRLIRDLVAFCNLAPATVAKRAGVAPSSVSRPYNGTASTRLGRSVLTKLQAAFPDFPGWAGTPPINNENRLSYRHGRAQAGDDMVAVHQIDLDFGLGAAIMDTEIFEDRAETLDFPRSWLRMISHSPPGQLCWARGRGNSMLPTIGDGDVILIDRSQRSLFDSDLIWAVSYGNAATIKRLRPMPDGGVKMIPDNPNVPPETAYDGELNIFGRVIAVVKRL
jgi:hypothetical protein